MVVTFTCTSLNTWTSLGMVVILLDGVLTARVRHGVLSFGWHTPADDSRKMHFLAQVYSGQVPAEQPDSETNGVRIPLTEKTMAKGKKISGH